MPLRAVLWVSVQRGNAEMYRRSWLVKSREQGLRYDAGLAVVLHRYGACRVAVWVVQWGCKCGGIPLRAIHPFVNYDDDELAYR